MTAPVLIAGAGLSGLSAAWHLHRRGVEFRLLEARDRLGGRALTVAPTLGAFDLGPSWIWHGQPHVAQLLQHFSIASHDQYCDGVLLHQTADGTVHQNPHLKPMQYAQRVEGGINALVEALAANLPSESIRFGSELVALEQTADGIKARVKANGSVIEEFFSTAAVAFPPRLATKLDITPELSAAASTYLRDTPTWMAAQAKFFAVYNRPFWREAGFSGDAFSATGILAEIHDASSANLASEDTSSDGFFALFGFVRLPAEMRSQVGEQTIVEASLQQLAAFFGEAALTPATTYIKDWSADVYTAARADAAPLPHHPQYRGSPSLGEFWQDRLHFISAETSAASGGLIEGALQRGAEFSATVA